MVRENIKNKILYITWSSTEKGKQTLVSYRFPFKGIETRMKRERTDIKEWEEESRMQYIHRFAQYTNYFPKYIHISQSVWLLCFPRDWLLQLLISINPFLAN